MWRCATQCPGCVSIVALAAQRAEVGSPRAESSTFERTYCTSKSAQQNTLVSEVRWHWHRLCAIYSQPTKIVLLFITCFRVRFEMVWELGQGFVSASKYTWDQKYQCGKQQNTTRNTRPELPASNLGRLCHAVFTGLTAQCSIFHIVCSNTLVIWHVLIFCTNIWVWPILL